MMDSGPRRAGSTVRETLAHGVARLEAAGVPSSAFVAELLLLHLLGHDRAWLYAHSEANVPPEIFGQYQSLLTRRGDGVPVQYLTGKQEFWGLEFEVNPAVLIPRPETEHLVETVLERLAGRRRESLQIADVGTGSGCIAVALARELPWARIVATDISAAALAVARRNAARHGFGERIEFRAMDLLGDFAEGRGDSRIRFHAIVSNPPYIGRKEADQLQREIVEHEPHEALFAGDEGLEIYPRLLVQSAGLLYPGGLLAVELGYQLAERVRALLPAPEWKEVEFKNDLGGIPRVLAATRS